MTEETERERTLPELTEGPDEPAEDGVAIVEMVLILAVILGLVLIFRTQVTAIITSVFDSINHTVSSII